MFGDHGRVVPEREQRMTITYAPSVSDQLLTRPQVAAYLQVPVATIHQWRYRGEGPKAARVGRHLRFRRADVDAWLELQSQQPAA